MTHKASTGDMLHWTGMITVWKYCSSLIQVLV